MGKRKIGRSVKKNKNKIGEPEELVQAPHSFVIHKGIPGDFTQELTKDFRKVMEPFTATHLKAHKKNTLKDFVSISGLLHVSHLVIFSRTEMGMNMKISRLPRGPTLTFKINNFSLASDVVSSLKKQLVSERAFKHSPLIVLNSFSGEGMHMKLMASMFQNMFPAINLTNIDLNTVRRCVLLNYNQNTKSIDFRHYTIKITPVGVSKGVKKVVQGKVPDLSNCNDIEELVTKSGILSESEVDDPNSHVTLSQKIISRGNLESGKSAIRLSELGPRLTLSLLKIEDGLLEGEVLYHDLIIKSEEEKLEMKKRKEENRRRKEQIKAELKKKRLEKDKLKAEHKERSLKRPVRNEEESDDDDKKYFEEEVGEKPENDLFQNTRSTKKRPATVFGFKRKKMKMENGEAKDVRGNRFKGRDNRKNDRENKRNDRENKRNDRENKKNVNKIKGVRDHRPIGGGNKIRYKNMRK